MEEQIKLLAEQVKIIQEQLNKQKKDKQAVSKDFIQTPNNPAMILTPDMNFDVWYHMITGELSALKHDEFLLEITDEEGKINYNLDDETTKGRLNFVSVFSLTCVDDEYKQSICEYKLPYKMLKHI